MYVSDRSVYRFAGKSQPKISQETPRASTVLKTVTIKYTVTGAQPIFLNSATDSSRPIQTKAAQKNQALIFWISAYELVILGDDTEGEEQGGDDEAQNELGEALPDDRKAGALTAFFGHKVIARKKATTPIKTFWVCLTMLAMVSAVSP